MLRKILVLGLFVGFIALQVMDSATLSELIQGIRDRSILIDENRFPDSLLKRLLNETQEEIAVSDSAIEKCTTIALTETVFNFALPSDFYWFQTAILNADPDFPVGENNLPVRLQYVPSEDYGASFSFALGRPEQFSIWNDSLRLNRASATGYDSVLLFYWAHATDMLDGDSTMSLPDEYESMLIIATLRKCYERMTMGAPSE